MEHSCHGCHSEEAAANIGRRTAIWLPIVTVPQILLLGVLFNQL